MTYVCACQVHVRLRLSLCVCCTLVCKLQHEEQRPRRSMAIEVFGSRNALVCSFVWISFSFAHSLLPSLSSPLFLSLVADTRCHSLDILTRPLEQSTAQLSVPVEFLLFSYETYSTSQCPQWGHMPNPLIIIVIIFLPLLCPCPPSFSPSVRETDRCATLETRKRWWHGVDNTGSATHRNEKEEKVVSATPSLSFR